MIKKDAQVNILINDKQAENSLKKLEAKAADLRQKFAKAFSDGDTKGLKKISGELQRVNKQVENQRTKVESVQAAMKRLDEAAPKDLRRVLKLINAELDSGHVKRGTKEWDAYVAKLKEVKGELAKVKKEMQPDDSRSIFDKIKDGVNGWGASMAAGAAAFAGVVMTGKAAVQAYADMEAEEANVRKYTGMTAEQVTALNEEFKKMDTRTSREELNQLAQEAGRLGKTSQEDVLGFVRAADQINVALDDLGDDATLTLSKLTGIFGDEERFGTEQSLLKVGSVINELSQNCSASAPYLAEFSSRLGGIAAQSKMSISQVMAFGAVLDSNNLAVEASSTAVGQLITKIYQEPAKIAKAAGMDVTAFSKQVKEDMNGALISLFEHLNQFGGMESLASVFDEMGTDGARAIPVLTALAGNIDTLKWQQEQANEAFREGTSVTNEYNVQNNTVQAQLDKAKKGFKEMAISLGEKLLPVMRLCISGTSMLMRVISVVVEFVIKYKKEILVLVGAIASYYTGVLLSKAATIAHAVALGATTAATKIAAAAQTAWNAVVGMGKVVTIAFTQGLSAARIEFSALNASMKANPLGLVLAGVTALTAGFIGLIRKIGDYSDKMEEAHKVVKDIREQAQVQLAEEKTKIELLVAAAQNETLSLEERYNAIDQLNKIIPGYNAHIDQTTGKYIAAKEKLDEYLQSLAKQYELEGAKEKLKEIGKEKAAAKMELDKAEKDWEADKKAQKYRSYVSGQQTTSYGMVQNYYYKAEDHLEDLVYKARNKMDAVLEKEKAVFDSYGIELQKDATKKAPEPVVTQAPSGITPVGGGSSAHQSGANPQEDAEKKAQEALKKDLEERKKLYQKAEADNLLLYITGQQSYADYLTKKEEQEKKYTDDVIKIHEDHNKIDIAAYGQALKSKADLMKKQQEEKRKRSLTDIEANHNKTVDKLTSDFYNPSSPDFRNKVLLNQALLNEDIRYLTEKRDLYQKGSEEWVNIDEQIQERNRKDQLDKQKELAEKIKEYKEKFGNDSRAAAFKAETELLELIHKKGLISEEEYQKNLEKIRKKYRTENMSESFKSIDSLFSRFSNIFPEQMAGLSGTFTEWLNGLSDEERAKVSEGFEKGFDNVVGNILINGFSGIASAIEGFSEAANGNWEDMIGKIGEMAQSAANIIGGIMQTFSSYWSAQRDLEVAEIEKRYDKEINAAGKNSKKKEKLEAQKEAAIAKIKNKYNDRAMKMEVAQAIAQTAANALGAYGAMVKIPVVGPALAAIAAAAATAAGMIQVATIKKQHEAEAAGYYEGGFTSRDPNNRREVGVVHANEFVANHQAVANPALSPVLRLIDTAQRNNTIGSLTASDVSNALGQGQGVSARGEAAAAGTDSMLRAGLYMLADSNATNNQTMVRLADLLDEGIEAKVILDGEDGFHKKYKHFLKLQNNPKR